MIRAFAPYKDSSGCDYHRIRLPFMFSDGYLDNTAFEGANGDINKLFAATQLVVFNREFPFPEINIWEKKREYGFKVVLDLDDFWELNPGHYLAEHYRRDKTAEKIIYNIRNANAVTVTTVRLAHKVRPYNRNVYVIPNALPYGTGQFALSGGEPQSDFSFIYTGQRSHLGDVSSLSVPIKKYVGENPLHPPFVLAGHQEGDVIWDQIESSFTCGGMVKNYCRIPNAPLDTYMKCYEREGAVLVPLLNNSFNRHKSNLKLLEAAAKKLPVICQRVPPYSDDSDAPVLWVDKREDWYNHMKLLSTNRELAKKMGQRLHNWALEKYNLFAWNKYRFELYEQIVNS